MRIKILFLWIFIAVLDNQSSAQGTWTAKAALPAPGRWAPFGFSIGTKGYLGTGQNTGTNVTYADFWEYDPVGNTWTQKANFGGGLRLCAAAFSMGGYGYAGTGRDGTGAQRSDFWRYDPTTNTWLQLASLATAREYAFAFSIGGKGYLGTGRAGTNMLSDLWEYDPASNSWTAKANYQGGLRMDIDKAVFVVCKKAYLGTGFDGSDKTDFWEYDPATNSWTQKANFPGAARRGATGFAIGNSGYLGLGSQNIITYYSNFWKYVPATNTWTPIANFPGGARFDAPAFVINNKAYTGCSAENLSPVTNFNDLWEYTPAGVVGGNLTAVSSANTICAGTSVTLTASGAINYTWSNGSSTSSIVVSPSTTTTYSVFAPGFCGGNDTVAITITSGGSLNPTVTGSSTVCPGGTATLTASGGGTYSWSNGATTASIQVSPSATTTYTVQVSLGGCSGSATSTVTVSAGSPPAITGNNIICAGDVVTLTASAANSYVWNTGATTASITDSPATTTVYSVTATYSGGCTSSGTFTVSVTNGVTAIIACQDVCGGTSATLTASGGSTYQWSTGAATSAITVTPATSTSYSVIVSAGSCSDTADCTVNVFPAPVVSVSANTTLSSGQSATLSASGGNTYLWSNGATDGTIIVSPGSTTQYCVTATDANGCTGTACTTVSVENPCSIATAGELFLPNAFSPNSDGENDILEVHYGNFNCLATFALVIYDRWGEKVFETTDPISHWDGIFKGQSLGAAVFTYYLHASLIDGQEITRKGNISLIK